MKWFVHICKERCLDPKTEFHRIVKQHMPLGLFPPFNTEAREQAEFPIDW